MATQSRQFALIHRCGKSPDKVIALVHFQDQRGLRADRRGEVAQVRAVGGADFDQPATRALDDVGNTEGTADLDQFATRYRHRPAQRERVQHQHQRGGIIVDDGGVLGPGQTAQQFFDVGIALATLARGEIEFERAGAAHRVDHGIDGFLR